MRRYKQDNGPAGLVMNMTRRLTGDTQKTEILRVLVSACEAEPDFCFLTFNTISARTNYPREQVRRVCRYLARARLAQFQSGLFDDDGNVAGSGYSATNLGNAVMRGLDLCASDVQQET